MNVKTCSERYEAVGSCHVFQSLYNQGSNFTKQVNPRLVCIYLFSFFLLKLYVVTVFKKNFLYYYGSF